MQKNVDQTKVLGEILTIWEAREMVEKDGLSKVAGKLRWVTAGTFEPFYAAGLSFRYKLPVPGLRPEKLTLGGESAYPTGPNCRSYISGTAGASAIQELANGKKLHLQVEGALAPNGNLKIAEELVSMETLTEASLEVIIGEEMKAVGLTNSSDRPVTCEMGTLLPECGNINFSGAGDISPLPYLMTATEEELRELKVFVGGAAARVQKEGLGGGTELRVSVRLKDVDRKYLRAGRFGKSGAFLYVGLSIAVPIRGTEDLERLLHRTEDQVIDVYDARSFGQAGAKPIASYLHRELSKGTVRLREGQCRTGALASGLLSRELAKELAKDLAGAFGTTSAEGREA